MISPLFLSISDNNFTLLSQQVTIPAAVRPASVAEQPLIDISSSLEPWAQKAFLGTKTLNTIQSRVFPTAYHSFENMLVSV